MEKGSSGRSGPPRRVTGRGRDTGRVCRVNEPRKREPFRPPQGTTGQGRRIRCKGKERQGAIRADMRFADGLAVFIDRHRDGTSPGAQDDFARRTGGAAGNGHALAGDGQHEGENDAQICPQGSSHRSRYRAVPGPGKGTKSSMGVPGKSAAFAAVRRGGREKFDSTRVRCFHLYTNK